MVNSGTMTKMKAKDVFRTLFVTDSHLNHPKLDCKSMSSKILRLIMPIMRSGDIDLLLFGGDWFDRPTGMQSPAGIAILRTMTIILAYAKQHGIAVRVLKGTGSHDGVQNENWKSLAEAHPTLDFAVYNDVDIVNEFGFDILVIPDSTIPNHAKCELEVRRLLLERKLTKVQLAFTHGMFTHHLKDAGYVVEAHDSDYYSSIISIVCLNGHIHKPSLYDIFQTGGSTDRTRQGENHPKGVHVVDINFVSETFEVTFFENKEAAIFNSYDITGTDVDVEVARLAEKLRELKGPEVFIRLFYNLGVSVRPIEDKLSEMFPNIVFDAVLNEKAMNKLQEERRVVLEKDIPTGMTPDNTLEMFLDKFNRDSLEFTPFHETVLEEIVNGIS